MWKVYKSLCIVILFLEKYLPWNVFVEILYFLANCICNHIEDDITRVKQINIKLLTDVQHIKTRLLLDMATYSTKQIGDVNPFISNLYINIYAHEYICLYLCIYKINLSKYLKESFQADGPQPETNRERL